jgi:hypothetical protein
MATVPIPQEVLNYINVLKWPVVVIGAVWWQRKPVGALIARISQVTTPFGAAEFEKQVGELRDRSKEAVTIPVAGPDEVTVVKDAELSREQEKAVQRTYIEESAPPTAPEDAGEVTDKQVVFRYGTRQRATKFFLDTSAISWDDVDSITASAPAAAINGAYDRLLNALQSEAFLRNLPIQGIDLYNPRLLAEKIGLPRGVVAIIGDLTKLRDQVVHNNTTPTALSATGYVSTTKQVLEAVNRPRPTAP